MTAHQIYSRHQTINNLLHLGFYVFLVSLIVWVVMLALPNSVSAAYTNVADCPDATSITDGKDVWTVFIMGDVTDHPDECGIMYSTGGSPDKITVLTTGAQRPHPSAGTVSYVYWWDGDSWENTGNFSVNNKFQTDFDLALGQVAFSNVNHQAEQTGDIDGATGYYELMDVILYADENGATAITFTSSGSTVLAGEDMRFDVTWSGLDYNAYYLYFYEDVEDPDYWQEVEYYPMGDIGSWTFYHDFEYPNASGYKPLVELGNSYCSTSTASGCVLEYSTLSGSVVVTAPEDYDVTYDNEFSLSKYSNVLVDEELTYDYEIDSDLCVSFSGSKLYLGYVPQLQYKDTGSLLTGLTGTGILSFSETLLPYSQVYFPRIGIQCDDGDNTEDWQLYLGGTLEVGRAQGVSVFEYEDDTWPDTWAAGGYEGVFTASTGTGYGLWSEKHVYYKGEPAQFKWRFKTGWDVEEVVFYKDDLDSGSAVSFTDADDLSQSYFHSFTTSYSSAGEYHPKVQLRASGGAQVHDIYLGGGEESDGIEVIRVTNEPYRGFDVDGFITFGDDVDIGIFGYSADIFSFTFGDNIFLKPFEWAFNKAGRALFWVASKAFAFISSMPVFLDVHDMVVPTEGATKVLPSTYFGYTFDLDNLPDRQFTIDYRSLEEAWWVVMALRFIVFITVLYYILNRLF